MGSPLLLNSLFDCQIRHSICACASPELESLYLERVVAFRVTIIHIPSFAGLLLLGRLYDGGRFEEPMSFVSQGRSVVRPTHIRVARTRHPIRIGVRKYAWSEAPESQNARSNSASSFAPFVSKKIHQSPLNKWTGEREKAVYVLTLQTNSEHHDRMTELRNKYFPKELNKMDAHLTLFHALPGSKLESSIIPHLEVVASEIQPFSICASFPSRLKKGVAICLPVSGGGTEVQSLHFRLQQPWKDQCVLSRQDEGALRPHYTIMNKVQGQKEVERAFEELKGTFEPEWGVAEGLGLWEYERGGTWKWVRGFGFGNGEG